MEDTSKNVTSDVGETSRRKRIALLASATLLLVLTAVLILRWNFSSDGVQIVKADITSKATDAEIKNDLVNINNADVDTLVTLPGIGETLANRIITYREEHGAFETIGDIMNVDGIGASKFGNIKDLISVS